MDIDMMNNAKMMHHIIYDNWLALEQVLKDQTLSKLGLLITNCKY
jgi:hypothetical protein